MTSAQSEPIVRVALTITEALWLKSAARRGAEDTIVPGARQDLYSLARKLRKAINEAQEAESR